MVLLVVDCCMKIFTGEDGCFHRLLCLLLSSSRLRTKFASPVTICLQNDRFCPSLRALLLVQINELFGIFLCKLYHTPSCHALWYVQINKLFGIFLMQTLPYPELSCTMACADPQPISNYTATVDSVINKCSLIKTCTMSLWSYVSVVVDGYIKLHQLHLFSQL